MIKSGKCTVVKGNFNHFCMFLVNNLNISLSVKKCSISISYTFVWLVTYLMLCKLTLIPLKELLIFFFFKAHTTLIQRNDSWWSSWVLSGLLRFTSKRRILILSVFQIQFLAITNFFSS